MNTRRWLSRPLVGLWFVLIMCVVEVGVDVARYADLRAWRSLVEAQQSARTRDSNFEQLRQIDEVAGQLRNSIGYHGVMLLLVSGLCYEAFHGRRRLQYCDEARLKDDSQRAV